MNEHLTDQREVPGPDLPLDDDERFGVLVQDVFGVLRKHGYTCLDDRARGRSVAAILALIDCYEGRQR